MISRKSGRSFLLQRDLLGRIADAKECWKRCSRELKALKRSDSEHGAGGRGKWNARKRPYVTKKQDALKDYQRLTREKEKMMRIIYDRLRNVQHTVFFRVEDHEIEIPENGIVELVGKIEGVEWDANTTVPAITFFVKFRPEDSQAQD